MRAQVLGHTFGIKKITASSTKGGKTWQREDIVYMHSLAYPPASAAPSGARPAMHRCFERTLQASLCRESHVKTYVEGTMKKEKVTQRKVG